MQAKAVGGPRGDDISRLLEQYLQVREDFARAARNWATIDGLNQKTNALQSVMWIHVAAIVRERPGPVSTSLRSALNETFDTSAGERIAFGLRLPPQAFWLLTALTLLSAASLGYQLGVSGKAQRILAVLLLSLWSAVIVDILDLASARLGSFRTDTTVYEWTRQGSKGGVAIPPSPGEH